MSNGLATHVCFDLDRCKAILWLAAYNQALANNLEVRTENASNIVLDVAFADLALGSLVLGPLGPYLVYKARSKMTDTAKVEADNDAVNAAALGFYERWLNMFGQYAERGLAFQYLEEKRREAWRYWLGIQEKFDEAKRINDSVTSALGTAYDNTHRVKVVCDLASLVIGVFFPVNFIKGAAVSLSYGLICRVANTIDEVGEGDIHSYSSAANDAAGNLIGKATEKIDKWAEQRLIKEREFDGRLERVAEAAEKKLAAKVSLILNSQPTAIDRAIMKAGMATTAPSQSQALGAAAREGIVLDKGLRAIALARRNAPPTESIEDALKHHAGTTFQNAPTIAGKVAVAGIRVAGLGVGLWFMKDDLKMAWYGKTEYDRRELLERAKKGRE